MKVLMVGATGKFAGLVLPELMKRGVHVRALVRNNDQATEARQRGAAETVIGDLSDPASLRPAAEGVDGVFHINPAFAPNESEMGVAMLDAAKAAGVRKFVFSSVIHPSLLKLTNHRANLPVEEAIYESDLDYTVLQPTMFMQNIEGAWQQILEHNRFALPYSNYVKASYVDYRDVAEAAAIAFTDTRLSYGTFELCSPGMYSRVEVAEMMSDALGRTIAAAEVPFEEWANTAHIPNGPVRDGLQRMYAYYNQYGFPGGNPLVLRAVLNRDPQSLMQFFQALANREPVYRLAS